MHAQASLAVVAKVQNAVESVGSLSAVSFFATHLKYACISDEVKRAAPRLSNRGCGVADGGKCPLHKQSAQNTW